VSVLHNSRGSLRALMGRRLRSFSMESIFTHIKKIPAHRRPAYKLRNTPFFAQTLDVLTKRRGLGAKRR
jgi:hypothetical protein